MDKTLIPIKLASLSLGCSLEFIVKLCEKGVLQAYNQESVLVDRRSLLLSRSPKVAHIPGSRIDISQLRFDPEEIEILKATIKQRTIDVKNRPSLPVEEDTPEKMVKRLKAEYCDLPPKERDEKIAHSLQESFELAYAKIGELLPANPGCKVGYEARKSRGLRLLGKK